jgi:predicted nuclease with TOPRIM domain
MCQKCETDTPYIFPWLNIKELGKRLKWRLHNTQQDLKEEKEDTTTLKETINQLQGDMEKLESELSDQGDLIKTKDEQIANLRKQLDHNNESAWKKTKKP